MKHAQRNGLCQGVDLIQLSKQSERAFSLLELMIVVLIIAILTTLYWGGKGPDKNQVTLAGCQQNLQKLFISMQIYADETHGQFPQLPGAQTSNEVLDKLVPKYTADTSLFICPASGDAPVPPGEPLLKHRISYSYYMGRIAGDATEALVSDEQVNTLSKAPGQQIFSNTGKPPGNNHKVGGNFLFCDGHVDTAIPGGAFSLVLTQGVQLLNPLRPK